MNVFGIDYDQVHCCIALREQCDRSMLLRVVGDGARSLIPLVVANRDGIGTTPMQWGSSAVRYRGDEQQPLRSDWQVCSPWLTSPGAPRFVRQLFQHLRGYIGRVDPAPSSGYATVVATMAQETDVSSKVKDLFCQAGFTETEVISHPQALLCDWLSQSAERTAWPSVVVAVAIGDTTTSALAIKLITTGGAPRVEAASPAGSFLPIGHEHLARRLLSMVWERSGIAPTEAPPDSELALSDAVIGFAQSLGRARREEVVEWRGPLAGHMFTDLQIQRQEVENWPEPRRWRDGLPRLVEEAVAGLGQEFGSGLVVLGGIGACWPFATETLKGVGAVELLPQVWESVARGSAWWPVFSVGWPSVAPRQIIQQSERKEIEETFEESGQSSGPLPPWERD
jgi:hypothetical protein